MCCPLISSHSPQPVPSCYLPTLVVTGRLSASARIDNAVPLGQWRTRPPVQVLSGRSHVRALMRLEVQTQGTRRLIYGEWHSFAVFPKLTRMHPQKSFLRNKELNVSPYDCILLQSTSFRAMLRVYRVYVDFIPRTGSVRGLQP